MTDIVMDSTGTEIVTETAEEQYTGYQVSAVKAPFENKQNAIYLNNLPVVTHIEGLTIINSQARQSFTIEQNEVFDNILFELQASGRTLKRLVATKDFFDGEKQFNTFANATADDLPDVFKANDDVGLVLTYGDLSVITAFNALQARFVQHYEAIKPVIAYVRAKIDGSSKLTISGQAGKRRISNHSYTIGEKTAKRLWDTAFGRWSDPTKKGSSATNLISVKASGYTRTARVYDDRIELGCQSFTRWQIENVAERMGWVVL